MKEGETYDVFTDAEGGIFWTREGVVPNEECPYGDSGIYRSQLQSGIEELPLYSYTMGLRHWSEPQMIGTMEWHSPKLRKPQLEPLVEDEYIREVEAYITENLSEKEKNGKYQVSKWKI